LFSKRKGNLEKPGTNSCDDTYICQGIFGEEVGLMLSQMMSIGAPYTIFNGYFHWYELFAESDSAQKQG